jgi:hypothetical protein
MSFDSLIGTWDVVNRRLVRRNVGSTEWEEFPGVSRCWRLFDGGANVEEIAFPTKRFFGLTLRIRDVARDEWSLYWADSRRGTLFPPVTGRFHDGRGEFLGDDTDDGAPVRVRFAWSDITATSARWEQAFSTDAGTTWETNWTMAFTRRPGG